MRSFFLLCCLLFAQFSFAREQQFRVEIDTNRGISYGTIVQLRFYLVNEKGKEKPVYFTEVNDFKTEITNGYIDYYPIDNHGLAANLHVCPFPKNPADTICSIKIDYINGKNAYSWNTRITLNYQAPLCIDFSGFSGSSGRSGHNKTLAGAILFFGGHDGEKGIDGDNGNDVRVEISKYGENLIHFMVINKTEQDTFHYYLKNRPNSIQINSRGGDGGQGGKGQRGEKGKGQDGGNGGNGGPGGNGGNGGSIEVYLQPELIDLQDLIQTDNRAGSGGFGGDGGDGGKGKKDENGNRYPDGNPGSPGAMGKNGINGPQPVILMKEF